MSKRLIYLILILLFTGVWIWSAINPLYFDDWLLENILLFIVVPILLGTRKRFEFSVYSYILITLFLILHLIGAHYTYAEVPWGETLGYFIGSDRNMYDRLIHLLFGILWTYPIYEISTRLGKMQEFWAYFVSFMTISAFAGFYEVVEWITAVVVAPEAGTAFLGTQGDIWDAQKDMMLAMVGAIVVLLLLFGFKKSKSALY